MTEGRTLTADEVRGAWPAAHREGYDGLLAFAAADPRFRFVVLCLLGRPRSCR